MKKWLSLSFLFIIIIIILIILYRNNKVPNLGVNEGQLKDLPSSPNAVSSQTEDSERYVEPLVLNSNSYDILIGMLEALDEAKIIKRILIISMLSFLQESALRMMSNSSLMKKIW